MAGSGALRVTYRPDDALGGVTASARVRIRSRDLDAIALSFRAPGKVELVLRHERGAARWDPPPTQSH